MSTICIILLQEKVVYVARGQTIPEKPKFDLCTVHKGGIMKLSMSLLKNYLSRYTMECEIEDDRLELRGVRFLSDQRLSLSSEYIYIGKADQYFSDNRYAGACLIASGKSRILCLNCDYEELLNDLMSAFEYYNNWEQSLREKAIRHVPMQELMNCAAQLVTDPMIVADLNGNILASCGIEINRNNPEIDYIARTREIPGWNMSREFFDSQGQQVQDLHDQPQRTYLKNQLGNGISMYLCQDGEPVAFCLIYELRERMDQFHLQVQSYLAPFFLQSEEITGEHAIIRSNHSILTKLLSGEDVPTHALEKFLVSTELQPPLRLLVLRNLTIQNYTQRSILIRDLNRAGLACFALDYEGDVLVLIQERNREILIREITTKLGLCNVAVGLSMPLHALENLLLAYRQACFALGYSHGAGVYACRDYALEYLMNNVRNQDMVTELLHPAIGVLEQYDKAHESQLLHTLAVYMLEDRNQVAAANRLHIHRNTMKYRLERIQDLTDIDYSEWEERFYLNTSLLLFGAMDAKYSCGVR